MKIASEAMFSSIRLCRSVVALISGERTVARHMYPKIVMKSGPTISGQEKLQFIAESADRRVFLGRYLWQFIGSYRNS